MKRYHIIRRFMSEKTLCKLLFGIVVLVIWILISGCVDIERTYIHDAPQNYTETLTLYPDGLWTGVFYEDRYFPQIALSGNYRNTEKEIILTTATGNVITFQKDGLNLTFEDDTWE